MAVNDELLKAWSDWRAGIGYLRDDGRAPGLYNASGIIGGANELRAAPYMFNVDYSALTLPGTDFVMTFAFDESTSATQSYLYAVLNRTGATDGATVVKIRTDTANFATVVNDANRPTPTGLMGQPARYQGNWFVPETSVIYKLTTVATPPTADTWSTGAGTGGNHLALINYQLSQVRTASGARVLAEDQDPLDNAQWGSYFGVGDKFEAPASLFGLSDLTFVVKKSGLYSFGVKNDRTFSGSVFEDFGHWRATFDNLPVAKWKSGAVIPHPVGLLYYTAGEPYMPIGIEARPEVVGIVPSGVTEFEIGRYHGVVPVGDYLYAIYQPDLNSTAAQLLCGFAPGALPVDITWQGLGPVTLRASADDAVHGLYGTTLGHPEAANEFTPSVWFTNAASGTTYLSYVILDSRGQPLRGRANVHRVVTSGDAWLSELYFPVPIDLKRLVVYAEDMVDGDEWRFSAVVDGKGTDENIGAPVIGSGRHERRFERHSVYRLTLHVNWTATSTAARVPPSIKRIELWGVPK